MGALNLACLFLCIQHHLHPLQHVMPLPKADKQLCLQPHTTATTSFNFAKPVRWEESWCFSKGQEAVSMSQIMLHWAALSRFMQKLLAPGVVEQLFSQLCPLFLGEGVTGCTQEGMLSHVFRDCLLKHRALGTCRDAQNSLQPPACAHIRGGSGESFSNPQ